MKLRDQDFQKLETKQDIHTHRQTYRQTDADTERQNTLAAKFVSGNKAHNVCCLNKNHTVNNYNCVPDS